MYKFTAKDFGWSPAWNAAYDVSKDTAQDIESNVSKYYAPAADEQYVGEQLQLLYNKLFDYLSDELMHLLPLTQRAADNAKLFFVALSPEK